MFLSFEAFLDNLDRVREQIAATCEEAGRPVESVALLPVTKSHPLDAALYAHKAGIKAVGENRVQEALGKIEQADFDIGWELIGPLQSNKAKRAAQRFCRIQTVDRLKILNALQSHAQAADRELSILLQVNAGNDPNKAGVSIAEAPALLEAALQCSHLKVDGLMTIAPLSEDPKIARSCFSALRKCRDELESSFSVKLPELSMGMSGDMRFAILEGSTMVRVGTALYGKREYA